MKNEMTRSAQPREKPAISPSATPMNVEAMVAISATTSDVPQPVDQVGEVVVCRRRGATPSGWSQVKRVERRPDLGVAVERSSTSVVRGAFGSVEMPSRGLPA